MIYCRSKPHTHRPKRTKMSHMSSVQRADPGCSQWPFPRAFRIPPPPFHRTLGGHKWGNNGTDPRKPSVSAQAAYAPRDMYESRCALQRRVEKTPHLPLEACRSMPHHSKVFLGTVGARSSIYYQFIDLLIYYLFIDYQFIVCSVSVIATVSVVPITDLLQCSPMSGSSEDVSEASSGKRSPGSTSCSSKSDPRPGLSQIHIGGAADSGRCSTRDPICVRTLAPPPPPLLLCSDQLSPKATAYPMNPKTHIGFGSEEGRRATGDPLVIGATERRRRHATLPLRPLSPRVDLGRVQGCIGRSPPPLHPSSGPSLCPATVPLTPSASLNGICKRQ